MRHANRLRRSVPILLSAVLSSLLAAPAAHAANVTGFSPQGSVRGGDVRQVAVNFDAPVRPLGDLSGPAPMTWSCDRGNLADGAKARWVDQRTWAVEFGQALPAGVSCEFRPVAGLRDAVGKPLVMAASYRFDTGGPTPSDVQAVGQYRRRVHEDAVFMVRARGEVDFSTVAKGAWCEIEGLHEKVPVRLLVGAEEKEYLAAMGLDTDAERPRTAILQCARRLPNGAKVFVVWGPAIKGSTGIATGVASRNEFVVREEFSVKVNCARENAKAGCNPFADIALNFTEPVLREDVEQIRLRGPGGKEWTPVLRADGEEGGGDDSKVVEGVRFKGVFPPNAVFSLKVPAQIRDEGGRPLANRNRLASTTLATADYPPLLKFAAEFGIVERKAGGLLPVTLRNLDPLPGDPGLRTPDGSAPGTAAKVRLRRLTTDDEVIAAHGKFGNGWDDAARSTSKLRGDPLAKTFLMPKPHGAKPMEVVGIPLEAPGYYLVEGESTLLGKSLLEKQAPMMVRSTALNTNLAVHFKKGAENQLVWVTTLDAGKPVPEARVVIRDCNGKQLAFGKTGPDGAMAVKRRLPDNPPRCERGIWGLFVSARATQDGVEDFGFTLSQWNHGIEPWRFQLPGSWAMPDILTHAVFDRPLFRVGETVNIKHFARRHTTGGFGWPQAERLPERAVIQLEGSDVRYELPLTWKGGSAESSWTVPADAKLGRYWVSYLRSGERADRVYGGDGGDGEEGGYGGSSSFWRGGSFRVAEFRLPVLKGEVAPRQPVVVGAGAEVDLKLSYLAGGGASGDKVRVRSELVPTYSERIAGEAWADFAFGTPPVDPGAMKSGGWAQGTPNPVVFDDQRDLALDGAGTRRVSLGTIPQWTVPGLVRTEMEYVDPAGEIHTAAGTMRWFPAAVQVGIAANGDWAGLAVGQAPKPGRVRVLTLDTAGKPLAGTPFTVRAWHIKTLAHRKRLVGGLYSYDTQHLPSELGVVCEGKSDAQGAGACDLTLPAREKGVDALQVVLEAVSKDAEGRASHASTALYLSRYSDEGDWYDQGDSDRIDVLPEKKRYEPGDTAVFNVRMPFREATALVTVEREGIVDRFVTPLSAKDPVVRVPVKPNYGPNVFVSVFVVRGRIGDVQPTALVDLGKPAHKLGIAEIEVGRRGYELKVDVQPAQEVYKTREEASVRVKVTRADGAPLKGGEFALAAVDEALLELAPNPSWDLLTRFLARRGYAMETSTAQSQVIGKRHFGLKAVPAGGGGGRQPTRELFDTLIKWQARVTLDEQGEAVVKLPLNDSLTRIRVVAVAHSGPALFGTGAASFRTTKDVQLFSGLPPVVRDADRFRAAFTVRNLTGREADFTVRAKVTAAGSKTTPALPALPALPAQTVRLAAGEGREVAWSVAVPPEATRLEWKAEALAKSDAPAVAASAAGADSNTGAAAEQAAPAGASDALKVQQQVLPGIPVRVQAATLEQLDGKLAVPVQRPAGALAGRGGVDVFLKPTLGAANDGVLAWMEAYSYMCLEQQASRALATGVHPRWDTVMNQLAGYMDNNGLVAYFKNPDPNRGSPVLTAYLVSASAVSGWALPEELRARMLDGLARFIEGRIPDDPRYWSPRDDLAIRKLKALEALSRFGRAQPQHFAAVPATPGLWPTGGLVSWLAILHVTPQLPNRAALLAEAENLLRARLVRSGTMIQFAREKEDYWWWLMDSPDTTVARAIATLMDFPGWQAEIPRMVRGMLARQKEGHWDITTANAWGVIMLEKFRRKYEAQPVAGVSEVALGGVAQRYDWTRWADEQAEKDAKVAAGQAPVQPKGSAWRDAGSRLSFDWPASGAGSVTATHTGSGKPWVTVQARAARPLTAPQYAGFDVKKEVVPVDRRHKDRWSRGDVFEVRLTVTAATPWTWVVIDDPVPAGASILGSGLGGESAIAARQPAGRNWGGWWAEPSHLERRFDAFRAYYEYFRGDAQYPVKLTYRVRLNNPGEFTLPPTRVEAMYAPENFGEVPNAAWTVAE